MVLHPVSSASKNGVSPESQVVPQISHSTCFLNFCTPIFRTKIKKCANFVKINYYFSSFESEKDVYTNITNESEKPYSLKF